MTPTSIVEIFRERSSEDGDFGSGYLLDRRHVLTARHVFCAAKEDARQTENLGARRLSVKSENDGDTSAKETWIGADCIWDSLDLDIAVLRLRQPVGDPAPVEPRLGELVGSDRLDCEALGFPRAKIKDDVRDTHRMKGEWDPFTGFRSGRLHVEITNPSPADPAGWKGMSGSALFVDDHLVGVVANTSRAFGGKVLEASPVAKAFRAPDFPMEPFGGVTPRVHIVGVAGEALLVEDLAQHLYLADRVDQVRDARICVVGAIAAKSIKPVILVVGGVPEDELDVLVDRFRYQLLPDWLPRRAVVGEVAGSEQDEEDMALLTWPPHTGDVNQLFRKLKAELRDALDPGRNPDPEARIDAEEIRRLLNRKTGPRAFCTYVRAKHFDGARERLLGAWIGFWNELSAQSLTEPVVYLICLNHDLPPRRWWHAINPLAQDPERLRHYAESQLTAAEVDIHFARLDDLPPLTWSDHVKPWLHDPVLSRRLPGLQSRLALVEQRIRAQVARAQALRMMELRHQIMNCDFS